MRIFICEEENCADLALECGNVNQQTAFDCPDKAINWLKERIERGEADDYVKDNESETDENVMKQRLLSGSTVSVTMFYEDQGNWDTYFDIVINPTEVK